MWYYKNNIASRDGDKTCPCRLCTICSAWSVLICIGCYWLFMMLSCFFDVCLFSVIMCSWCVLVVRNYMYSRFSNLKILNNNKQFVLCCVVCSCAIVCLYVCFSVWLFVCYVWCAYLFLFICVFVLCYVCLFCF